MKHLLTLAVFVFLWPIVHGIEWWADHIEEDPELG